ncbi:probable G-protein coupled receptor 139 [Heterodontus francisci]|uniref:probable G-protein coupled receptor 139 n=1 Tax=Heterodontus francisci TaxID=7792 RepID=UPI00355C625D
MGYPVIYQIEDIYYPVIAAIGVPVNLVAIVILSRGKCGLSKCITVYLVGMAVADLLVVITEPILKWIVLIYFPDSFLRFTPVCSLIRVLLSAATVVSVWLTVTFTFDRFVAICCEKLKTKYCSEQTAAVVVGTVSVLGCSETVPWYFTQEQNYIIDNVPMGCEFKLSFFTYPTWAAFDLFDLILIPCVPVFLILMLNVLTVRRILFSSKVRKEFRGHSNGENHKDPELENRRKSIILLFSISGSFILLWVTLVVFVIYRRFADIQDYLSSTDPLFITDHTANMLQVLSSCTNTCIYTVTQTKFRQELKKAVKYPFNLIVTFLEGLSPSGTENPHKIVWTSKCSKQASPAKTLWQNIKSTFLEGLSPSGTENPHKIVWTSKCSKQASPAKTLWQNIKSSRAYSKDPQKLTAF